MSNRVICCLAVSAVCGVLYGRPRGFFAAAVFLLMLAWMAAALLKRYGRPVLAAVGIRVLLCILAFAAGNLRYQKGQQEYERMERLAPEGRLITLEGEISRREERQGQFIYHLTKAGIMAGDRLEACQEILVYTSVSSYQPGNRIQVTGTCESFQLPRNEGNFNEKQYYRSKKTGGKVIARQISLISAGKNRCALWAESLKERLRRVFLQNMPKKEAGILINMTLGDKNLADAEIKELYQRAGISHILAISGLHISLFGMGVCRLLKGLRIPVKGRVLLSASIVSAYGIFTGMAVSTGRAVLMFVLLMGAEAAGASYDSLTALGTACLVQVWENPFVLEQAGFLLSYTAVLGVTAVAQLLKKAAGKKREEEEKKAKESTAEKERRNVIPKLFYSGIEKVCGVWFVSFSIQLVTLPISMYFYYTVPGYSVFTNGCILPFMGLLLFLGILGGITGLFWQGGARLLLEPAVWILRGNEAVCTLFLKLPGAEVITGKPEEVSMAGYYLILGLLLYFLWKKKKRCYLPAILVLHLMLVWISPGKNPEIDFLDVGQGDGIFLRSAGGENFFIDGGSSSVSKVGTYRILPFLKCRGVKQIEVWFVSHADADHINGLEEVLESGYPVEYLALAEGMVRDEAWEQLAGAAEKAGTRICYMSPGQQIQGTGISFTALHPKGENSLDRNAASLVLLAEWEGKKGLLTGDIGMAQEQEIVRNGMLDDYGGTQLLFYKAAHHGSNGSNGQAILKAVCPKIAVVSCGAKNSYGHPGKEAVARMEEAGSRICYTMEGGQIKLESAEGKIEVKAFQN